MSSAFRVYAGKDGALHLAGQLDIATVDELEAGVEPRLDGEEDVVLDLAELEFIDSTGIRSIIRLARDVDPRMVVLRDPQPNVERTLNLVRLDGLGGILIRATPVDRP